MNRLIHGAIRTVLVRNIPTQIVGPSEKRVALVFLPPTSPSVYTASTESNVAAGAGVNMTASIPPVPITAQAYGDAVTKAWYGIAPADTTVAFFETVEE